MNKKLYISLFFSNLVKLNPLSSNHRMYNLYTKVVKILEICKQINENLDNELVPPKHVWLAGAAPAKRTMHVNLIG